MTNQQIENIEDINEAINPITPPINGSEGLEILGHNRNQSVNLLRFSRSFFKIYSHLTGLYSSIKSLTNGKEDKIIKNDAFNKNFGTNKGEILEGHRMAQILGVEDFGGDVQTPGVKKAGYSYWCTANKDFYVCKVENSLNYIDNNYFDAFSNAALLGKLQNLVDYKTMELFYGCRIWKLGNLCGIQLTNVFSDTPDNTWTQGTGTGGAYTYAKTFTFPNWFKTNVGEVGIAINSSDLALTGELMLRNTGTLHFYIINIFNRTTRPTGMFSLSGCASWPI